MNNLRQTPNPIANDYAIAISKNYAESDDERKFIFNQIEPKLQNLVVGKLSAGRSVQDIFGVCDKIAKDAKKEYKKTLCLK